MTHICVSKSTIIGSDNGLSPGRRQAIISTNAGILLIRPLGTNFNEMLIGILTFSFMKMHLKLSSVKRRPFCTGGDELKITAVHPILLHLPGANELKLDKEGQSHNGTRTKLRTTQRLPVAPEGFPGVAIDGVATVTGAEAILEVATEGQKLPLTVSPELQGIRNQLAHIKCSIFIF